MWKRVSLIAAEVLLVLLTLAAMTAILLPVFTGVSPDAVNRDQLGLPMRPK